MKNKDGVEYDSGKNYRFDYSEILLSLEAHVNSVIDWICEDVDGYDKRDGDIPMKTLTSIDKRYEDEDMSDNIRSWI